MVAAAGSGGIPPPPPPMGGMGMGVGLAKSLPLLKEPSLFKAVFKLYSGVPFWKVAIVGGGARAASSAGGSTPSSTHLLSFSS